MELVTKVKDAEHWGQLREASDKKLLVVDVHKDWCGPCKIMEPTYKRLSVDIDQAEKRVAFATLNVILGVEGVEDNGSCKPRFVLFRERKPVAEVSGANAPQLEQLVKQHCPPLGNDDEEM
uniref:Thioredoxin domain-containing protein n=1 Tax=Globisporangium ultimum (strain ATCC 200006 / CBS 805.95 / DAOM BR144) TaxID=431595 RepID=K3WXZ7_GLOUD